MRTRKLRSGRRVKDFPEEVSLTILSKCPDKWLFVDLETCDVWHRREPPKRVGGFWRGAREKELKELISVALTELRNLRAWNRDHKPIRTK